MASSQQKEKRQRRREHSQKHKPQNKQGSTLLNTESCRLMQPDLRFKKNTRRKKEWASCAFYAF